MKAVILAGGLGTRISEESHMKPKPMIGNGGRPILWHIMKIYSAHGVNDFMICRHCHTELEQEFLDLGNAPPSNTYFSSTSKGWLKHGANYCEMITKRLDLLADSFVVELASNDELKVI